MPEIKQKPILPGSALPWMFAFLCALIASGGLGYVLFDGDRYVQAVRMTHVRNTKENNYSKKDFFDKFENSIILMASDLPGRSIQETSSYYRALIYENTDYVFAEEYKEDISVMYSMMEKYLANKGPKPSLVCDGRAYFMRNILFNLGIESRIVHGLYVNSNGVYGGHTFLEVLDMDSSAWVVHDPTFNISYMYKKTGALAGLLDLCLFDIDEFVPTVDSSHSLFAEKKGYFAAIYSIVVYDNREQGKQSVIVFNKKKLGIATMDDFFQKEEFSALRNYLIKKWYDYVWIDI